MELGSVVAAQDALVLTRAGARAAATVAPGTELLGLAGGAHAWSIVSRVEPLGPRNARRLTTRAGTTTVVDDVRIESSTGPVRTSEVSTGEQLELVHPGDLPPFSTTTPALRGLQSYTAVLPTENGCADAAEVVADRLLGRAGFCGEKLIGGRWLAMRIARERDIGWDVSDEAELAVALHAWSADDDGVAEARVRIDDRQARELVLGALISARAGYESRAVPAYSPCDLRVTQTADAWPAYSPVTSCRRGVAQALLIEVDVPRWSLIADLVILRPVRRSTA